MKHQRKLVVASLSVLPLVACEPEERTPSAQFIDGVEGTIKVDGEPKGGVTVAIAAADEDALNDGSNDSRPADSYTTDDDGSFSFGDLSQRTYRVYIDDIPDYITFDTRSKEVDIASAEGDALEFSGELERTAALSGRVTADEEGVEDAKVKLEGPETITAGTDEDGVYQFDALRPGDYTVQLGDLPDGVQMEATERTVTLGAEEADELAFEGEFVRTAELAGGVTVEDEPIEGAAVSLDGPETVTATTDRQGAFRAESLRPGSYVVRVEDLPDGVEMESTEKEVELGPEEPAELAFAGRFDRTSGVAGTVESGDDGISGVTVQLQGPENVTVTTDRKGAYRAEDLPPGRYEVSVDELPNDVDMSTTEQWVDVASGTAETVDFSGEFLSRASVAIQEVRGEDGSIVDQSDVSGRINVTLSVHEANDRVDRVVLMVDGEEVAVQTLSGGGAASASFTTTVGFNTTRCQDDGEVVDCDESESGEPRFLNGERELKAAVDTERGGEASAQASTMLEFNNQDRMTVRHRPDLGDVNQALEPESGVRFWGGGDVVFEALPVMYSGREVGEVTARAAEDLTFESETVTEAPFLFTAPYTDEDGNDVNRNAVQDDPNGPGHSVEIRSARYDNGEAVELGRMDVASANGIHFDLTPPDVSSARILIETEKDRYTPESRWLSEGNRFVLEGASDSGSGIPSGEFRGVDVIRDSDMEDSVRISEISTTDDLEEASTERYVAEVPSLADRVGNETNPNENPAVRTDEFGVDLRAPVFEELYPAERLILNGDGGANERGVRFTAFDPELADDSEGSGVDPRAMEVSVAVVSEEGDGEAEEEVTIQGNHPALDVSDAPNYHLDPSHRDFFGDGKYEVTVTASDRATEPNTARASLEYILITSAPSISLTEMPGDARTSSRSVERRVAGTLEAAEEELGNAIDPEASTVTVTDDGDACDPENALPEGEEAGGIDRNQFSIDAEFDEKFRLFAPESGDESESVEYCVIVEAADMAKDNQGEKAPNVDTVTTQFEITWR